MPVRGKRKEEERKAKWKERENRDHDIPFVVLEVSFSGLLHFSSLSQLPQDQLLPPYKIVSCKKDKKERWAAILCCKIAL